MSITNPSFSSQTRKPSVAAGPSRRPSIRSTLTKQSLTPTQFTLQPSAAFNVTNFPTISSSQALNNTNISSSQGRDDSKSLTIASIVVFTFFILFMLFVVCCSCFDMKEPPLTRTLPPSYHKSSLDVKHESDQAESKEEITQLSSSISYKSTPQSNNESYV